MSNPGERNGQWRAAEPFRSLPPAERDRLAPHVDVLRVDKDETIFQEGDRAQWAYFVGAGRIQLRHLRRDGVSRIVCMVGPGETFCCLPAMDGRPYPATATAATPAILFRLPLAVFQEWLGRHPAFTAAALHQFCGRLREFGCESGAGATSAAARVADKLLRMAKHGETTSVTRRELGEMAGVTVETAIRVTKDFEHSGWVKLGRGRITVVDAAALESCANGEITVARRRPLRLVTAIERRG